MTRAEIEKAIALKKSELAALEELRSDMIRNTPILCSCSDQTILLWELVYLLPHRYVSPFSCMGGDYWVPETNDARFKCPHCSRDIQVPDNVAKDIKGGTFIGSHVHAYHEELYLKIANGKLLEDEVPIKSIKDIPKEVERLDLQARLAALDA